jgi:hypothetical protein
VSCLVCFLGFRVSGLAVRFRVSGFAWSLGFKVADWVLTVWGFWLGLILGV